MKRQVYASTRKKRGPKPGKKAGKKHWGGCKNQKLIFEERSATCRRGDEGNGKRGENAVSKETKEKCKKKETHARHS